MTNWILDASGRPVAPAAGNEVIQPRPAGPWDANKENKR